MKKALVVLAHCVINMLLQIGFGALVVFFYDYSVSDVIIWTVISIGLIGLDYLACITILKEKNKSMSWIGHCADLVLAIPYLAFRAYYFYLYLIDKSRLIAVYSKYEIVCIIGILFVDLCLIVERIRLIKHNH